MNILTLSGWTQPIDAVKNALGLDAATFDYSDYSNPEASYAGLNAFADTEHVIGWSMGGQLAIRAIVAGVLKPKKLTLIAAPYQFVSDETFRGGMDPITYQQFRDSYARNPERTLQRFHALIAKGDVEAKRIIGLLGHHPQVADTGRWLPWLDALGATSLRHVDLSALPPTLLVQGTEDTIVSSPQAAALKEKMPHATLDIWHGTGHAPHLHDKLRLLTAIEGHS